MYYKLKEVLDKCVEKWWKPFWTKVPIGDFDRFILFSNEAAFRWLRYSYHDLFSKDSWLLEQFEWHVNSDTNIFYSSLKPLWRVKYSDCIYMVMWPMTVKEKIQYFIENTII